MRPHLAKQSLLVFCALSALLFAAAPAGAAEFERYGLLEVGAHLSSEEAGTHADLTTVFKLTRNESSVPYAQTRDIEVHLPPGVIGNPQAIPRCTVQELGSSAKTSECPVSSQVGVTRIRVTGTLVGTFNEPVYNMEPPKGSDVVARLGLIAAAYPTLINVRVDPSDYSLVASVQGASSAAGLVEATTTLWGVPAAHVHDGERMTPEEAETGETPEEGRQAGIPPAPFLSNPTDCSLQRQVSVTARSYQLPDQPSTISAPFPQIKACGNLKFSPTFGVVPTNPEASAPTGLDAELEISQDETPQGRATSTLKSARVTLPEGLAINPAAGDGLAACSSEQVGFGERRPASCPRAAKIGSVEIEVPALEKPLHGAVFQRTPEPGHRFQFWLLTDEQGVQLKLPAEIEANPQTGQLTTIFNGIPTLGGNPQVPFSSLRLHVSGGPRAPLSTPAACGTYQTHFELAPWSGKAPAEGDTAMQITAGCGKGGFSPDLQAGTLDPSAGSFSPLTFTLTRKDGEANPRTLALHLPPGLLAKLGGVPLCPDIAASSGSCPPSSRIGSLTAAVGVGALPLWIPQPGSSPTAVYLAGRYEGAPYSALAVVPAQAGPFDLGTVVSRAGIYIDPETAAATIKTDPLPQILAGVPVLYRALNVTVERPEFTLNPTDCSPKQITATVGASNGAGAEPSAGFQATDCAKLGFKPKLTLRLKGKTARRANPTLIANLKPRPGDANISYAQVTLPRAAFLDNAHIGTICTRVQYAADACPAASVYGRAQVRTPLLDYPLSGTVYMRSSSHPLPDLVVGFNGPPEHPIRFTLVGRTDSAGGALRNTFEAPPDVPLKSFRLELFGGRRGLVELSSGLCADPRAKILLKGQNGRRHFSRPKVKAEC